MIRISSNQGRRLRSLLLGVAFIPGLASAQDARPAPLLPAAGEPSGERPPPAYAVEFKILNVRMGDRKSALEILQAKAGPVSDEGMEHLAALKGVRLLSSPYVTTLAGQPANITVGQIAPQYFERSGNHFVLKQLDGADAPGLFVDVTVRPGEEDPAAVVQLQARVRITIVKDRVKLPGVELDVGQPVVSTQVIEVDLQTRLYQWMLLKTLELEDPKPGWSNAFAVIARVKPGQLAAPGGTPTADADFAALEAKSDTIERTPDGSLVRLYGNVSVTLPDQSIERPDGSLQTGNQVLLADRLEIHRLEEPLEAAVRAKRIMFTAADGTLALEGDVEIVHRSLRITAERALLREKGIILVSIDEKDGLRVNGDRIVRSSFGKALEAIGAGEKSSVIIRAAPGTSFGTLAELLKDLEALGVARVSFLRAGAAE